MKIAVGKKSRVTQPVSWRTVLDCVFSFGLIEIKPGLRSYEIFIPSCKTLQKIFFFCLTNLNTGTALYLLSYCPTAESGSLEVPTHKEPKSGWTQDLERAPRHVWRLSASKALQTLNAGGLSSLPFSISSPKQFANWKIPTFCIKNCNFLK